MGGSLMPRMVDAFVLSWSDDAYEYAEAVRALCHVPTTVFRMYSHEVAVLNYVLANCRAPYCWLLTDEKIVYPETPHLMAEWMDAHKEVAVMVPNREGEPPGTPCKTPYRKYLADNTAMMVRTEAGLRFDREYPFTGWSDLDFGLEAEYQGYEVHVETRASVVKGMTPYGAWSSYRRAVNARSRLLLEAKWYWIGRRDWRGIDTYNQHCEPGRRIPTVYEMFCWSNEELDAFCGSVNHEHPQIQKGIDGRAGNEDWKWPITR